MRKDGAISGGSYQPPQAHIDAHKKELANQNNKLILNNELIFKFNNEEPAQPSEPSYQPSQAHIDAHRKELLMAKIESNNAKLAKLEKFELKGSEEWKNINATNEKLIQALKKMDANKDLERVIEDTIKQIETENKDNKPPFGLN